MILFDYVYLIFQDKEAAKADAKDKVSKVNLKGSMQKPEDCDDDKKKKKVPEDCHPKCSWTCDSPSCSQICEPVCEKPKCETRCQELECSKCEVKCNAPQVFICPF